MSVLILIALTLYVFTLGVQQAPLIAKRHVNPYLEVEWRPSPLFFTLALKGVFSEVIKENFGGATSKLKEIDAIWIPEALRFIYKRFLQLMDDLIANLNEASSSLSRAEEYIKDGKLEGARGLLNSASYTLHLANATYKELYSASREVSRSFYIPWSELDRELAGVKSVIDRLYDRLNSLIALLESKRALMDTYIEVEVYPIKAWTGSSVHISGRLYSKVGGLEGRYVRVYLDGADVMHTETLSNGFFKCNLSLPYFYKPRVTLKLAYYPSGHDESLFKPTSKEVELEIIYITPIIEAVTEDVVYPGKYFKVRGLVRSQVELPYREVRVSWMGSVRLVSLQNDAFEAYLYTPGNAPIGKYALIISTPPHGIFGPSILTKYVQVDRIRINASLEVPSVIFAGLPAHVKCSLKGLVDRANLTIRLVIANEVCTLTTDESEFTIYVHPGIGLMTNVYSYELYIEAHLPWYQPITLRGDVVVVNLLTIFIPATPLAVVLARFARREGRPTVGEVRSEVRLVEEVAERRFAPEDLKWIVDAYWKAVVMISNLTGIDMKPHMTMREFLYKVKDRLGDYYGSFEALTYVAEKVLYAPKVSEGEVKVAEEAFRRLSVRYVESTH